jgi:hypothetical protein
MRRNRRSDRAKFLDKAVSRALFLKLKLVICARPELRVGRLFDAPGAGAGAARAPPLRPLFSALFRIVIRGHLRRGPLFLHMKFPALQIHCCLQWKQWQTLQR